MEDDLSHLPHGGVCSYCERKDECPEIITDLVFCEYFQRKTILSTRRYNGREEPISNSNGHEYLKIDGSGNKIHLKQFGEYECLRCGFINFIPQTQRKITEPFECAGCGRKNCFKRKFPIEIINPPWKAPTGIIQTESPQILFDGLIMFLRDSIYFDNETQYDILALWIMASWVNESFNSCPYLMFIAPKESGKTRGMDILSELAYRPLPAVSFTSSSMFRSIELWKCTLLVDEAEYQLNSKSEKGQDLYGILNGGYKKGMFAIRTETVSDSMIPTTYDIFGFKAIAATRPFNPTLESRSIILSMTQHQVKNMLLPVEICEELRNRLLYFRYSYLYKLKITFPEKIKKGRLIEIFYPIYSIANLVDSDMIPRLDKYLEETYFKGKEEDKVSLPEADLIRAINEKWDDPQNIDMRVYLKDIVDYIKYDFPDMTSQQVGYLLKAMGFIRGKDRIGMYIDISNPENKTRFDNYKERFAI